MWYVNHQGRVKGTCASLGISKKRKTIVGGWVAMNLIVYKDIFLLVACYHLLVDFVRKHLIQRCDDIFVH